VDDAFGLGRERVAHEELLHNASVCVVPHGASREGLRNMWTRIRPILRP
jgi:hypothetical protein